MQIPFVATALVVGYNIPTLAPEDSTMVCVTQNSFEVKKPNLLQTITLFGFVDLGSNNFGQNLDGEHHQMG